MLAGPGRVVGRRLVEHPEVAKIAFTGSTEVGHHGRGGRDHQAGHPGAGRQVGQPGLCRRRPGRGRGRRPDGRVRQRRPGLLRPLAHPGRAVGHGRVPVAAGAGRDRPAGRRPGRRADPDGPADLGRPARDGGLVRARGTRWPSAGPPRRPRLLVPADRAHRRLPGDRAATEEIFGPVAVVLPFADEDEAVRLANASIYGLSGSVWTRDLARGLRVVRRWRPAPCRSTPTPRSGSPPPSAASSSQAWAASSAPTPSTTTPRSRTCSSPPDGATRR